MRITVIGTGYVGLVTGICLADNGNDVIGYDIDAQKIETLQAGKSPLYEAGVSDLLLANLEAGRIRFTTDARPAIEHGQTIFLTVGTPPKTDGSADLAGVQDVVTLACKYVQEPKILVIKSTVPVGTGDHLQSVVEQICPHHVAVVSNPEFLKEGMALDDFLRPDRIIIGASDPAAGEVIRRLYLPFVRNSKPILLMSRRAAEMSKYAANAYLAMRISFINEMACLCDSLGVDIDQVRQGIGSDSRIGHHFLYPGPGYGGSCFPKDVQALSHIARCHGVEPELIEAIHKVNERQKGVLFGKVARRFGNDLTGRRFAVWGVTFKAKTDDIRESPALRLIDQLLQAGAQVVAHDPEGLANLERLYGRRIAYQGDCYLALQNVDGLIIVTEWNRFRSPDFGKMRSLMKMPVVFDGRNLYDPTQMQGEGFEYHGIGRQVSDACSPDGMNQA